MSLAKIAEERLASTENPEGFLKAAARKLDGMSVEQMRELDAKLAAYEAEKEAEAAAEECIASGALMAQGFDAELKTAGIDLQGLSEFLKAAQEHGIEPANLAEKIAQACEHAELLDQVLAEAN